MRTQVPLVPVVAIIHAPDESESRIESTKEKLLSETTHRGLRLSGIWINPRQDTIKDSPIYKDHVQLILVWATDTDPDWNLMTETYCPLFNVSYVVGIASEHLGRFRIFPDRREGGDLLPSVAPGMVRNRFLGFLSGCYYGFTPYGYQKTPMVESEKINAPNSLGNPPCCLELGASDEIAVVEFIFHLFDSEKKSFSEILTCLIEQRVDPPFASKGWSSAKISSILSDPVYVGANRYRGFLQYDVFPPVISKEQFFRVQARLCGARK